MIVVGIDPGLRGAIARIEGDDARVWDMPVTTLKRKAAKERDVIDPERLAHLLGGQVFDNFFDPEDGVAYVEWAQASQNMGTVSAFRYGEGFGILRGVLAHLGVPVKLTTAAKWKRYLGLITPGHRELGRNEAQDKRSPLDLAKIFYPRLAAHLTLAKHEGRAEGLLIAHYGCEQEGL